MAMCAQGNKDIKVNIMHMHLGNVAQFGDTMLRKRCIKCGCTIDVLNEVAWGVTKCRDCLYDEETEISLEETKIGGV